MLWKIESKITRVTRIPYKGKYDDLIKKLDIAQIDSVLNDINRQFDNVDRTIPGQEFSAARYIAGADWTDSVYEPLWDKACLKHEELAGNFLGQLICRALIERERTGSLVF